nr:RNA-directed DNA polymerase, eukaryota, reverse transcriptase zinc-binding domain protein [Tanacetum cinerariifolium]
DWLILRGRGGGAHGECEGSDCVRMGVQGKEVDDRPWCLLGDFNAPLFVEDTSMGSSSLDVTMCEFKECVENMEVMDFQRTGLQYTWSQKPKGKDGILRKLDRVLANLEFLDVFMGAHAVFKP